MDAFHHYLAKLKASLLVIPLAFAVLGLAGAQALLEFAPQAAAGPASRWIYAGDADGARDLLGALLSGIITMFSLVLSVTMVVLTLAAQQIGSRLIRTFIDDRVTQTVVGLFLGTLLYLLVVLGAIDGRAPDRVPHLAVSAGMLLSVLCLVALLFYIDKLARSIVFDHAAARMSQEVRRACEHLQHDPAPRDAGDPNGLPPDAERLMREAEHGGDRLALGTDGYVQSIAYDALLRAAERADVRMRLDVRPGHWVNADTHCIVVLPAASPALATAVRRAVIVGTDRTPTQDLEYSLQRLVEMALRALSPGLNDVFTALAAIDNIGASVAAIFSRPTPSRVLRGGDGRIRLVRTVSDPAGILEAAFDQVRQSGATMPAVAIRLLDALGRLAPVLRSDEQRAAALGQLDAVLASARVESMVAMDADAVRVRYRRARAVLTGTDPQAAEQIRASGAADATRC